MLKRFEKVWLSLLLTTVIYIGVSRMYYEDSSNLLEPSTELSRRERRREATSPRSVTRSMSQLAEETNEISRVNDDNVLFFNRVPKTGSEMIVLLMQWMQGINGYRHVRLPGGKKRRLELSQQRLLVEDVWREVEKEALPISFDRHVYFTNFTLFDQRTPTFINLVRDPVDKAVSRYYYRRVTPNPLNPDIKFIRTTTPTTRPRTSNLEKCIQQGDSECSFYSGQPYDLAIPYFCGHHRQCTILNDRWALARAKKNIEEFFPVVGVLEELNATLAVLEHKLPRFFRGVTNIYYRELLEPHKNKNRLRPRYIDPKTREHLEKQLSAEYDLYNWVKARLLQQSKGLT